MEMFYQTSRAPDAAHGVEMFRVRLDRVLWIAALLVACAGVVEYFALGEFFPAPFVVAVLLGALSLAALRWGRAVALVSLALAVLIPIAAWLAYRRGDLVLAVPVFDFFLFAWVFASALRAAGPRGSTQCSARSS